MNQLYIYIVLYHYSIPRTRISDSATPKMCVNTWSLYQCVSHKVIPQHFYKWQGERGPKI